MDRSPYSGRGRVSGMTEVVSIQRGLPAPGQLLQARNHWFSVTAVEAGQQARFRSTSSRWRVIAVKRLAWLLSVRQLLDQVQQSLNLPKQVLSEFGATSGIGPPEGRRRSVVGARLQDVGRTLR